MFQGVIKDYVEDELMKLEIKFGSNYGVPGHLQRISF